MQNEDTPEDPAPPSETEAPAQATPNGGGKRLLIELGPLLLFFFTNAKFGIYAATGVFMVAIVVSLAVSWHLERRLPPMACVTAVVVLVFGGLTLWLEDEVFIKLKPTIVNSLFAVVLLVGLLMKRSFLKVVFGPVFQLSDEGWRVLTVRWMFFFVLLAILNEYVWRTYSTDTWVSFKVFGIMPLTLLFTFSQMPLILRHQLPEADSGGPTSAGG